MKLQNNEKRMEIRIDSYEFPYDENSIYEDNNWLNVALEWEDEVVIENAISPCLTCAAWATLYIILYRTGFDGEGKAAWGTDNG